MRAHAVLNAEPRDPEPLNSRDVSFTRALVTCSEDDLLWQGHLSEERGSFVEGLAKEMAGGELDCSTSTPSFSTSERLTCFQFPPSARAVSEVRIELKRGQLKSSQKEELAKSGRRGRRSKEGREDGRTTRVDSLLWMS